MVRVTLGGWCSRGTLSRRGGRDLDYTGSGLRWTMGRQPILWENIDELSHSPFTLSIYVPTIYCLAALYD
jgi:hypothetical protein